MAHPGRPRKCDPRVKNLMSNIRMGNYEVAKDTLKEFGIDATDSDGRSALINSVIENKIDFIYWLIDNGADVNAQDRIGYSVLHFCSQNTLTDLTKCFLKNGVNPNLQDIHGNTALWTAILNSKSVDDSQKIINILLEFGANPTITNKYGISPGDIYRNIHNSDLISSTTAHRQ